jgi:hypothetical protein
LDYSVIKIPLEIVDSLRTFISTVSKSRILIEMDEQKRCDENPIITSESEETKFEAVMVCSFNPRRRNHGLRCRIKNVKMLDGHEKVSEKEPLTKVEEKIPAKKGEAIEAVKAEEGKSCPITFRKKTDAEIDDEVIECMSESDEKR